jgi:hypothetical protein
VCVREKNNRQETQPPAKRMFAMRLPKRRLGVDGFVDCLRRLLWDFRLSIAAIATSVSPNVQDGKSCYFGKGKARPHVKKY